MKSFLKREKGAVTVFLIIIVAVIFFLNSVLIDFARIITAKYQVENALKTAVRSVLSSYDTELYINTGLFGIDNDETQEIYEEVLTKNLEASSGFFNFNEILIDESDFNISKNYELANQTVFEHQILEEMKYKAPIDFTLNIADQFTSLSLVMKEATNTTTTLRNIKSEYDDRNDSLLDAIEEQKEAISIYKGKNCTNINSIIYLYSTYSSSLAELNSLNNSVESTGGGSEDTEDEEAELNERRAELAERIEQSRSSAIDISTELKDYYNSKLNKYLGYLEDAKEELESARIANNRLRETIENADKNSAKLQYDRVNKNALETLDNNLEADEIINNLKKLNEDISENKDFVLEDEYFDDFLKEIDEQAEMYKQIKDKLATLANIVERAFSSNATYSSTTLELKVDEFEQIRHSYDRFFANYNSVDNKITSRERVLHEMQLEIENQTEGLEDEAEDGLSSGNELIDLFSKINNRNDEFAKLESIFDKYIEFNNVESAKTSSYSISDSADDNADAAIAEMDGLFNELANILEGFRNELYVGEYSFSRFNYFDFTVFKEENVKNHSEEDISEIMAVKNQEIEYIIYGYNNLGGNIAAALRDIFIIRLAINLMEAFTQPAVLAATNPLLILLEAMVYAIATTVADMALITMGEDVPLAKKIKNIKFGYEDYLRILYLIRGDASEKLTRIQTMIDYKYGKDLCDINTYVKGSVNTSIRLWFIPGVMKAINHLGVLDGQVEGNRYIISKTSAMSY